MAVIYRCSLMLNEDEIPKMLRKKNFLIDC